MNSLQTLRNKFSIGILLAIAIFAFPLLAAAQGKIAFTSNRDGNKEIYVMNPDGTSQTRLTNNSTSDDGPAFSPDGSKIAFQAVRDGDAEIYVMNADGSAQTNLTNHAGTDDGPTFSPDGSKIAFTSFRNGTADIYVMDANGTNQIRLTTSGGSAPAFSPDGSKIVFMSFRDGNYEIFLMNADGSGQTNVTNNSAQELDPTFSPDGSKIAFRSNRDGDYEIYVMNVNGSGQTNLTNNTGNNFDPTFSPDGSKIAFQSSRDLNPEIYVMNADGSNQANLTSDPAIDGAPSWGSQTPAQAGKIVFFSDRDGNFEVYTMNPDGSNQVNRSNHPARDLFPAFSPDGSKIAFQSSRDGGLDEIYIMNADGSSPVRLTDDPAEDLWPKFSPDGSRIVFASNRDGDTDIYIMDADGSDFSQLTNAAGLDLEPEFSPDGSKIVFTSSRTGDQEIYIMDANGANQVQLTNNSAAVREPTFSPDGSKIAFSSNFNLPTTNHDIFIMDANGSNPINLTNQAAHDLMPSFSPDGSRILYASNQDNVFNLSRQIFAMDANGSNISALTELSTARDSYPSWVNSITSLDPTPPVVTSNISGTLGNNGWYTSNIGVSWTVADDGSEVSSQDGCDEQNVTADTAGVTFTCSATSGGGTTSESVTVKRDSAAPAISLVSRTAANSNGWNNGSVEVQWGCSDALSGVMSSGVSQIVATEGQNQNSIGTCEDNAGHTASDTQSGIKIDKTAPNISFVSRTAANANGWNKTDVAVLWNCSDGLSGAVNPTANKTLSANGQNQSAAGVCDDKAGNTASDTQNGINIDKTAPTLTPAVSPNPVLLGGTAAATSGAADPLSGLASESCAAPDMSTVGAKTVNCTATDKAGNTVSADASYSVIYNFAGFFQPVDNLPVLNIANAGSSIPIKFSLNGNQGLSIFTPGYPASVTTSCNNSTAADPIDETVNAGGSSLTYDAATDRYHYVWKTEKSWKGTCRLLVVKLKDGNTYIANFKFK
ncbi:MAG: PxKF domain-containing protein [Acidobacteriota bacterium]|nr:PxKF domain-containing protein [Acidobacteriota bacterium]